jgi:hypothetical protein
VGKRGQNRTGERGTERRWNNAEEGGERLLSSVLLSPQRFFRCERREME